MTGPLLTALLAASSAGPASIAPPEKPAMERIVPASEGRMLDMRSLAAWQVVHKRIEELGFRRDEVDRRNQALLTAWRPFSGKGMEWLPKPSLPPGYVPEQIQFLVFVSPFVEPARLYVGSVIVARGPSGSPATAYNVPTSNKALMAQIAKALGSEGVPIPHHSEQRRQLGLSLLNDGSDGCLRNPPKAAGLQRGDPRLTEPRKIRLSEREILYPGPARDKGKGGKVVVEFTILEDGAVSDIRLLEAPPGYQFETAAMGAASLLLYAPTRIDGCPVAAVMTHSINFRSR